MISSTELSEVIRTVLQPALAEDLGAAGDVTTAAIFPAGTSVSAVLRAKEAGILAGSYLIEPLFRLCDPDITVTPLHIDGDHLVCGSIIARIEGSIHAILAGERTILNLLQRLSGIATKTAALVALIEGTGTRLLDTRKTTPNLRLLERAAVVAGGGCNHRFGLFDMILIKDTHVKAAGGPGAAVRAAQAWTAVNGPLPIEVEVQNVQEFMEAAREKPFRIMLDNMGTHDMSFCVTWLKKEGLPIATEASGNVTEKNIRGYAETGVDCISAGSLTHSVRALDIHLLIE